MPRGYFRIKKRYFAVLLVCLLLVALPVLLFLFFAISGMNRELVSGFALGERAGRRVLLGSGLNLGEMGDANLLRNASFEPVVYRKELAVRSGSGDRLLILDADRGRAEGDIPVDEFFVGARAEILSRKGRELLLRKETTVREVHTDQITEFHDYNLPSDTPANIRWRCFASNDRQMMAAGSKGYALLGLKSAEPRLVRISEKDIVALCATGESFVAVDAEGAFFVSGAEGLEWKALPFRSEAPVQALCGLPSCKEEGFLAVGSDGFAWLGNRESLNRLELPLRVDFFDCLAAPEGYFICGEKETLLHSTDGRNWRVLHGGKEGASWKSISSRGGQLVLAGGNGRLATSDDAGKTLRLIDPRIFSDILQARGRAFDEEELRSGGYPSFQDAVALSGKQILLSTESGEVFYSRDSGDSFDFLPSEQRLRRQALWYSDQGMILAAGDFSELSYALSGLEIVFEDALEEGHYKAGDLLRLEKLSALPRSGFQMEKLAGDWLLSPGLLAEFIPEETGSADAFAIEVKAARDSDASRATRVRGLYSGKDSLPPSALDGDNPWMAQALTAENLKRVEGERVFRLEFRARTPDAEGARILLQLKGFQFPVEAVPRRIDGSWRKYSALFVLPGRVMPEQAELWLQIQLEAGAVLQIDQLQLLGNEDEDAFQAKLERISAGKATTIRWDCLRIGHEFLPSCYWLRPGRAGYLLDCYGEWREATTFPLREAAAICEGSEANPWLLITPWVGETELRRLFQYLFGGSSTEYGKLRASQGMAARWNESFPQIYFELCDPDGKFDSDQARQNFVDWAIHVMAATPEYKQVKNEVVFVDGMSYQDGVLLSTADCHASELLRAESFQDGSQLKEMMDRHVEALPRDPARALERRPEFLRKISSASPEAELRAAELLALVLQSLTEDYGMSLLDEAAVPPPIQMALLRSGRDLSGMNPLTVTRLTPPAAAELDSETATEPLLCYAFEAQDKLLVFALNLSQESRLFELSGRAMKGLSLLSFEADGGKLSEEKIGGDKVVTTVLPGGFTVIGAP